MSPVLSGEILLDPCPETVGHLTPLRNDIEWQATFQTRLYRVSVLGTGGFGGTRGVWIPVRGPKWLTVGTDSFMVSAPQALREWVFTARESSIARSQAPSRFVTRDWIVITRHTAGREARLAVTCDDLSEAWQALAGTGVALAPAPGEPGPGRAPGRRRLVVMSVSVVLLPFIPALVILIARHLR
jgi:hypothetical protein